MKKIGKNGGQFLGSNNRRSAAAILANSLSTVQPTRTHARVFYPHGMTKFTRV